MSILSQKRNNSLSCIFPFYFRMFCAILHLGRAQAACSSHQKMAASAFSIKTRSEVNRAQGFTNSPFATRLGRLLQMPNWMRILNAMDGVCGRESSADMAAPALFYVRAWGAPLGWSNLCAISGCSMTVRAYETAPRRAAAFVRPQIQKVRTC